MELWPGHTSTFGLWLYSDRVLPPDPPSTEFAHPTPPLIPLVPHYIKAAKPRDVGDVGQHSIVLHEAEVASSSAASAAPAPARSVRLTTKRKAEADPATRTQPARATKSAKKCRRTR